MKDYKLIRYLAEKSGAKVDKKNANELSCYYNYTPDACVIMVLNFANKQSREAVFDISEVYKAYASTKYASTELLIDAIIKENTFFKKTRVDDKVLIYSDLKVNTVEHCVSPALANLTVVLYCLNDILGRDEPAPAEEDWRDIHRTMLFEQSRRSKRISIGAWCVCGLGVAYDIFVISQGGASGFLGFLFIVAIALTVASPIAAVFFLLRHKYYKKNLQRSLSDKPLNSD